MSTSKLHRIHAASRIVALLMAATMLVATSAASHAAERLGNLRVSRVQARASAGSARSLVIQLRVSRAGARSPLEARTQDEPERFRIHLEAAQGRWRSGWIDAPPLRPEDEHSMTCVIRLADRDLPDEVRIAIVGADGRMLAEKRWRRPAPAESQATLVRWAATPRSSPAGATDSGRARTQPVESTPTVRMTWGQLKMLYRDPFAGN